MKPETKFEQTCCALIAMALTVAVLPIIGLWAAGAWVGKMITRE